MCKPVRTITMRAVLPVFMALIALNKVSTETIGSIATINTYDGKQLGPYIVKEIHSHSDPEAHALVEEGSGDINSADDDTEGGDDDPSNGLPVRQAQNELAVPAQSTPTPVVTQSKPEASSKPLVTQPEPTPAPGVPQPEPTPAPGVPQPEPTPAPEVPQPEPTPAPSVSQPQATPEFTKPSQPSTPDGPTTVEVSPCYTSCRALVPQVSLTLIPDKNLVKRGSTIAFTCRLNGITENGTSQFLQDTSLHWEYEGGDPPQSWCALDDQPYRTKCENFNEIRQFTERNASFLSSHIVVTDIDVHNFGYFKCQVRVECCSSILQHELSRYVTVWEADYSVYIIVMCGVIAMLSLTIIAWLVYRKHVDRTRMRAYKQVVMIPSALTGGSKVSTHQPFPIEADENDSFSSNDSLCSA
ncbi:cyclin-dependent kinase 12 isoform X2 [Hyalella azteca]|uniref:Cyclin-dependent kinase 12 isoform X2 n=1 Tax=Hyalella azteca TaxID=294128 RepID=A0A8B7PLA9_HYAAZ|nr:cyclin-dependent kinase 12 isoform X2 [Hyalella azteca]